MPLSPEGNVTATISSALTLVGAIGRMSAVVLTLAFALAASPAVVAQVSDQGDPTQPPSSAGSGAPTASELDAPVRATLSRFGTFRAHPTYGEVWFPTVTPPDWRPYAACHWVNSRTLGWYYDDRTPWGAIIHHNGRWAHDASVGWFWVPGRDFGPGWVSWRSSPAYIGWAPLPPNGGLKTINPAEFDRGGFWTFLETAVFDRGCAGAAMLPFARTNVLLGETQPVTTIALARGVWVAVLPDYIVGPLVDIAVDFKPWSNNAFLAILTKWNAAWNSLTVKTSVNVVDCRPKPPRRPPTTRRPPPLNACAGGGYLQPDGRCGAHFTRPPPPSQCADGGTPDPAGRCRAPPQSFAAVPVPVEPPPPAIVPVAPPPGGRGVPPACPAGLERRDGRCVPSREAARPPTRPTPPVPIVEPRPKERAPTLVAKPPEPTGPPAVPNCRLTRGEERRRCIDAKRAASGVSGPTTVTVEAHGSATPPPSPVPSLPGPSRPMRARGRGVAAPQIVVAVPAATAARPSPSFKPAAVQFPAAVQRRPATVSRPARRPAIRTASRPRLAAHRVFSPARVQFKPRAVSRPVSRPRTVSRPVSRPAPRRGGGGGGRRRR